MWLNKELMALLEQSMKRLFCFKAATGLNILLRHASSALNRTQFAFSTDMPYHTRSRARALLSSIEEQEATVTDLNTCGGVDNYNAPPRRMDEDGPAETMFQRESTPSVVARIPVPQTPHTTNQSMLDALERAPKKKALKRSPDRIGAHHGINLYRLEDSDESWLKEKKMALQGSQLVGDMQMESQGAQEKIIIFRELQALRQDQEDARRTVEQYKTCSKSESLPRTSDRPPDRVHRLGPEGTWVFEDDGSQTTTTRGCPGVNQRLGPEGTFLI